MEITNTANLADPYVIDSLAPGHEVSDLPILKAVSAFRRSVLEQGDGGNERIQACAGALLDVVHFVMTGVKIAPREIQNVSVGTFWTLLGGDQGLLIEIVDINGAPFKYQIEPDTYLSKKPRLMERIKDAKATVHRLSTAASDASQAEKDARAALMEARTVLEQLENNHAE